MISQPVSASDTSLRWTMRVLGFLLAVACAFLMTRNLIRAQETLWLLGVGTGLGVITFITSWLPVKKVEPERVRS